MEGRYRVDLLDDLDTHFPDLLYNQSRFHTIGDVLDYVYEGAIQANEDYYLERVRGQRRINLDVLRQAGDLGEGEGEEETEEDEEEEEEANEEDVVSQVLIRFREDEEDEQNDERPRQRPRLETIPSAAQPSFLQSLLTMPVRSNRQTDQARRAIREFFEPVPVVPTAEQIENSSTVYTYAQEEEDHNCPICQDSITLGESIRSLNHCHHFFHQGCIDAWLESSVRCPLCRHDIRETQI